jgi:hypothetical protein
MTLEILRRTPIWVWPLLLLLLYLGYAQTRTRPVPVARVAVLPVLMPGLSIFGMLSVFGADTIALGCWLAAVLAAVALVRAVGAPRAASWSPVTRTFIVPGSWWPLALIMAIFFTRYAVAVALAMNPSLPHLALFTVAVSVTYGLPSGFFIGRALNIWHSAKPTGTAA